MRRLVTLGIGCCFLFGAVPALAHHSFAAEFDGNKPATLKGTLTKVEWVNPHGWIHMDVKGEDGKVVNWAIETGPVTGLLRRGIRVSDFPPGIELVVKGYLSKNGTPTIAGSSVTLADGRDFLLGAGEAAK